MGETVTAGTLLRELGKVLQHRRQALGWTLEEARQRLGFKNASPLSRLERGEQAMRFDNLARYAEVLGLLDDMALYVEVLGLLLRAPQSLTLLLRETLRDSERHVKKKRRQKMRRDNRAPCEASAPLRF